MLAAYTGEKISWRPSNPASEIPDESIDLDPPGTFDDEDDEDEDDLPWPMPEGWECLQKHGIDEGGTYIEMLMPPAKYGDACGG